MGLFRHHSTLSLLILESQLGTDVVDFAGPKNTENIP